MDEIATRERSDGLARAHTREPTSRSPARPRNTQYRLGTDEVEISFDAVGVVVDASGHARSYFPGLGATRQPENAQAIAEIRRSLGS